MTPIRTATNAVVKTITVKMDPYAIAITPDGKTVYVASLGTGIGSGTVTSIRTATNTVDKRFAVGNDPYAIAITP